MKYSAVRLLLVTLLLALLADVNAQKKSNHTLLWRIQKGDGKPSFLFGTMHISDKKAFNFTDSLYNYLKHAEAFALEFNPDSANQIIAAYMAGEFNESPGYDSGDNTATQMVDTVSAADTTIDISDISLIPPPLTDSLATADSTMIFSTVNDDTPNFIEQFKEKIRKNKEKELSSMATFMDAYLYEMARQHDKKIFGLETLKDKGDAVRALSNGLKTNSIDSLFDSSDLILQEQLMDRLYLKEDLDSIELYYTTLFEEKALDIFLYKRNSEMVTNMDKIMHNHTLFAAVGAAHLPGDKGIISMLRKVGYTVEPVFSKKRIAADSMQIDLNKRKWQTLSKAGYGFQFRLPGVAQSQDGADGRKIVYHYDIGGGTLFMTAFGVLDAAERGKNIHEIVNTHLDARLAELGGRALSKKTMDQDGTKAIEAICLYGGNGFYRYREIIKDNLFYIFTVSSEKKENLFTEKAEEYFKSFESIEIPSATWAIFEAPADGFTIRFPNKPEMTEVSAANDSNSTTGVKTYTYFDVVSNTRFTISPGRALAGQEYFEGEVFFNSYITYLNEVYKDEPFVSDSIIDGYPAKFFQGKTSYGGYRGFIARRGNTSYYTVAEYEDSAGSYAGIERFLASFRMTPFTTPSWKFQESPAGDFSAWLPGEMILKKQDSTAYNFKPGELQYYGHDPFASIAYNVELYPVSKYFWSSHIDSLYNFWKNKVVSDWNDSLVYYKVIKVGNLEGREICKIGKISKDRLVLRLLLNGETMYILSAASPFKYADENNATRFFEEFRFHKEMTPSPVFSNHPGLLFADLQSGDSATFHTAYSALDDVHFISDDIMLLLNKALLQYPAYDGGLSVNMQLLQIANTLFTNDTSIAYRNRVIQFIRTNYGNENKVIDSIRFYLLGMVASGKNRESYQVLADLVSLRKNAADYTYQLFGKLYDSLQLTRALYPQLLDYVQDTTMGLSIVMLTKTLIDSSFLTQDDLLPAKKSLLNLASHSLKKLLKNDNDEDYAVPDLLELLAFLEQKDCDEMIKAFLKVRHNGIRKKAAVLMISNKRVVPTGVLGTIAGDAQYRAQLYIDLKRWNREKLFPVEHRSQVAMAESYIFTAVFDEEEDEVKPDLIYIKKVEYLYRGKKSAFYIFRCNYEYTGADDEENGDDKLPAKRVISYFTVAGPFDIDASIITLDEKENISGMWYEEEFDGMKNDYFFSKYIEQRLKWRNERE